MESTNPVECITKKLIRNRKALCNIVVILFMSDFLVEILNNNFYIFFLKRQILNENLTQFG